MLQFWQDGNSFAFLKLATKDFADGIFAKVVIGGEGGDEELGALFGVFVDSRGGNIINDGIKNDMEIII